MELVLLAIDLLLELHQFMMIVPVKINTKLKNVLLDMSLLLMELEQTLDQIVFHVEEILDQLNNVQPLSDLLLLMDVNLDMF